MVRDLSDDKSRADDFEKHVRDRSVAHFLFGLRCSKDVSQKNIAEHFGSSQSKISKFESSEDDVLRLGDLKLYLDALGMEFGLLVHKKHWTVTDQIKFHARAIRDCLRELRNSAKSVIKIADGVTDRHIGLVSNAVNFIMDSASGLPNCDREFPQILNAELNQECDSDRAPDDNAVPA